MRKLFLCILTLFGLLRLPVFSEQKPLTLDEAVSSALKNHPQILRAQKEIEAAQARTLQLGAIPNPELVFSNEGIPFRSAGGERELSLGLRQLIEFPGKRTLRRALGQSAEGVSEANLERLKLLAVARVKKAYWKAVHSEMAVALLQSILETLKEYQTMAAIRFQAGEVSSTDVLRGRLEEVRVRNEIIEMRRTLQEDKAALWLEMGVQTPPSYPPLQEMSFTPFAKGLDDLRREVSERPSVRALRREVELRQTSVELAKKSRYPDLGLGLFYPSLYSSGWGFEIGLTIPLRRQAFRGEILEAEALREQGMISLNSALRMIMIRAETSYADVQAAAEQLKLIEASLLPDAADLLSSGILNYQYGKIDSLNLFDIYRMHKQSRLEYLRALFNYNFFLAELEAAGEDLDI
ncbi:MAG: TolC family protein [Acidobacteriota bacterium]